MLYLVNIFENGQKLVLLSLSTEPNHLMRNTFGPGMRRHAYHSCQGLSKGMITRKVKIDTVS